MEAPCLCPFKGHKYGRRKPTETSVFEFSYLYENSSLGELIKIKVIFILRQGMFRQQNLQKSAMFLTHIRAFLARELNAASRKSLEIQASCIAKQRTLLDRKFVCIKVLRRSSITSYHKIVETQKKRQFLSLNLVTSCENQEYIKFVRHSFSLFAGIRPSPQTNKTSKSTASLSLPERWTITEIRRQSNFVLTYSLLTYVFLKSLKQKTITSELELIKPLNFQGLLTGK